MVPPRDELFVVLLSQSGDFPPLLSVFRDGSLDLSDAVVSSASLLLQVSDAFTVFLTQALLVRNDRLLILDDRL